MSCHTDDHIMYIYSTNRERDGMTLKWHCLDCPKVETEWRKREEVKDALS